MNRITINQLRGTTVPPIGVGLRSAHTAAEWRLTGVLLPPNKTKANTSKLRFLYLVNLTEDQKCLRRSLLRRRTSDRRRSSPIKSG